MTPYWGTLDLFLSIDVALELIHADRESLKRVDTFAAYPGQYGHKVQDTIEEVFIFMLQTLAERHLKPGFERCERVSSAQVNKSDTSSELSRNFIRSNLTITRNPENVSPPWYNFSSWYTSEIRSSQWSKYTSTGSWYEYFIQGPRIPLNGI